MRCAQTFLFAALFALAGCGQGPLGLDAAEDLLPKALERGERLLTSLKALDSGDAAAKAKPTIAALVDDFADMYAQLNASKAVYRGEVLVAWRRVVEVGDRLQGQVGAWTTAGGAGPAIVAGLGSDLVDRIASLGS